MVLTQSSGPVLSFLSSSVRSFLTSAGGWFFFLLPRVDCYEKRGWDTSTKRKRERVRVREREKGRARSNTIQEEGS